MARKHTACQVIFPFYQKSVTVVLHFLARIVYFNDARNNKLHIAASMGKSFGPIIRAIISEYLRHCFLNLSTNGGHYIEFLLGIKLSDSWILPISFRKDVTSPE